MLTVYDRYLLRGFAWIYLVVFLSTFGLFVVIDLMDNFDDFVTNNGERGTLSLLGKVGTYYGYFAFFFFQAAGPALTVIAAVTLLIMLERAGELKPLLAAGIPTYRLAVPLLVAGVGVNLMLVANREFVIPQIAHQKYASRGRDAETAHTVESVYDHTSHILIDGQKLFLGERRIERPRFVLPAPAVVHELTTIDAGEAVFHPASGSRPSGWLVRDPQPAYDAIGLTTSGSEFVHHVPEQNAIFIASPVGCDHLYKQSDSATMLSTFALVERIRNPAFGWISARRLVLHFHHRIVAPLVNVICVMLVIPLMIRRGGRGMVANTAVCLCVLGGLFGVQQAFGYLGQVNLVAPSLSAWAPVLFGGSTFAWISDLVQT